MLRFLEMLARQPGKACGVFWKVTGQLGPLFQIAGKVPGTSEGAVQAGQSG